MRSLKVMLWIAVALVGAFSYAVITRLVHPAEKVNALWLIVAALCTYALAYRFYAKVITSNVFGVDDSRPTPALANPDGCDYHATNRWVLFGHHFAAIAGPGPLIGPILAAQFGYLPGALWILLGAVLAGGVQDLVILVASIRRNGNSLPEIARKEIGPIAGIAASIVVLFVIIVALASLALVVVNALTHSPWGTFTIFCTIPIAIFMGIYHYRLRPGRVVEMSVIGVALLILAVVLGHEIIGTPLEPWFNLDRKTLIISIGIYGFLASVLPVWLLLCPRDYLSTYMKIGTVVLLAVGILFIAPDLQLPATTVFLAGNGPVIPGAVFPFLFITIACGAISGFHTLVSSGTTSKMISRESDARMIGYGAMLVEGFVGIMGLIAAAILIPGDYFAINTKLSADVLAQMGFAPERVKELSELVGTDVQGRPGGAVSLAVGMASILSALPLMKGLMAYWYNFALMFEALFILTVIDAGTRIARFLLQEMSGFFYAPLGRYSWMPGTLVMSTVAVSAWVGLLWTGTIATLWPMLGVANQLLAALALAIATTVFIKLGKIRYTPITVIPMIFMFVITLTAAWQLIFRFWALSRQVETGAWIHQRDAILVAVMAGLAVLILIDSALKWYFEIFKHEERAM